MWPAFRSNTHEGRLYISLIAEEEYRQGTAGIKKFLKAIEEWPKKELDPQDEELLRNWLCNYFYDSDIPTWWDYPPNDWFPSGEEKIEYRKQMKKKLVQELASCQEHFDIRLCASAAHEVALAIGRTGLRLFFQNDQNNGLEQAFEDCPDYRPRTHLDSIAKDLIENI